MLIRIDIQVTVAALNIRPIPSTLFNRVGILLYKTPVTITEVVLTDYDFWGKISNGWICLRKDGVCYTNLRNFSWYYEQAPIKLARVAAERWEELHGQEQPRTGGPLVQVASSSTKGGKYINPLGLDAQNFIKKWNNQMGWAKISAPDVGPSQGIDPVSGKLKWNYLVWPSGTAIPNRVKVIEVRGDWTRFETIPLTFPVPTHITPETTPWLFHKMCDNRGNPFIVQGSPVVLPIFGLACWVPSRALIYD